MLKLIFPNLSHKESYLDMLEEWKNTEEFKIGHVSPWALFRGNNFEEFLQIAIEDIEGNRFGVPATLFFFIDWEGILWGIQIRHHINHPNLMEYGWHIGYGIRPSERRKWYATKMLELALVEVKKLWIDRVLLGCYDDNIASQKTIENNGGIFERYTEFEGKKSRRYWIEL